MLPIDRKANVAINPFPRSAQTVSMPSSHHKLRYLFGLATSGLDPATEKKYDAVRQDCETGEP